jgi:hypothetical protein
MRFLLVFLFTKSSMIPSGTLRASPAPSLRPVTHPASSLRRLGLRQSGGVQPRRGRHGRCSGPPEAALRHSAPSRPRPPSAALPVAEACPPYRDRRGPRCARQAPGHASTAARTTAVAALWVAAAGRRARSACAPACGSGRFDPCGRVRDGPALAVSARSPWASQGGRVRAVTQSRRNRLHGRRGGRSSACRLALPAAPTVAAERRSCPRA